MAGRMDCRHRREQEADRGGDDGQRQQRGLTCSRGRAVDRFWAACGVQGRPGERLRLRLCLLLGRVPPPAAGCCQSCQEMRAWSALCASVIAAASLSGDLEQDAVKACADVVAAWRPGPNRLLHAGQAAR